LVLAFSAWIYGLAQRRAMSGKPARGLTLAAVAGLVVIGGAFAMPGQAFEVASGKSVASVAHGDRPIRWSPQQVAQQTAAGRPVFVDFSAAWCLTCKVNEKAVFDPDFKQAIARTDTAFMIADSTNYDAEIEKAMSDLGRTGLPLYLVYPAEGANLSSCRRF
jgi:thiol:disulfide interchange protein DsbD